MKTAATLIALATGASAFTGTQPASRSTAMRAAMDKMDGSIDLRGKEFKFDPVRGFLCCNSRGMADRCSTCTVCIMLNNLFLSALTVEAGRDL